MYFNPQNLFLTLCIIAPDTSECMDVHMSKDRSVRKLLQCLIFCLYPDNSIGSVTHPCTSAVSAVSVTLPAIVRV